MHNHTHHRCLYVDIAANRIKTRLVTPVLTKAHEKKRLIKQPLFDYIYSSFILGIR